jgi:hypothetical protein
MKKRWLVRIGILLVSGCAVVLISPAGRYGLVGLLRNEPFYDHRPASYWKDQMRAWIANESKPPPAVTAWLPRLAGTDSGPSRPRVLDGGKEAVPVLIELVEEEDVWVRTLAIRSLARIGPEAREAVPALITVLGDNRAVDPSDEPGAVLGSDWAIWPVYREAAEALGAIGPDAKGAVPDLIKLRPTGSHDYTSSTIDHALKHIDPAAAAEAGVR